MRSYRLGKDTSPEDITNDIIKLAVNVSEKCRRVSVSGLTLRTDNLGAKARLVNKKLIEECGKRNICFIMNDNINAGHLNRSKLHLNKNGTKLMTRNLANYINKE